MRIVLQGNPISTNHLYKITCNKGYPHLYMTKEAKLLKEQYQWQAKTQWKKEMLYNFFSISIKLYFNDKKRRDWDNWHKIAMDSLTGIVWFDDSLIKRSQVEILLDKENPRVEIEILEF